MKSKYKYRLLVDGHQRFIIQRIPRNPISRFLKWLVDGYDSMGIGGGPMTSDVIVQRDGGFNRKIPFSDRTDHVRDVRKAMEILIRCKEQDEKKQIDTMRKREITKIYEE